MEKEKSGQISSRTSSIKKPKNYKKIKSLDKIKTSKLFISKPQSERAIKMSEKSDLKNNGNLTSNNKELLVHKKFENKKNMKDKKKEKSIIKKEKEILVLKKKNENNINNKLYGFNLYKHVKENLRNKEKLCKDKLTKESYYCMDCKISTCKKCINYNIHKNHNLIPKYLYYNCDENFINSHFNSLNSALEGELLEIDNQKLKEQLKSLIIKNFDNLIQQLTEIKINKLKEIEKLFENTDGCISLLKEKEKNIKDYLKNYFNKEKDFYNIIIEEEINTKESSEINAYIQDLDLIKNFKFDEINNYNYENNKDSFNIIFLTNYDLIENINFVNKEIRKLISDIIENKNKYIKIFENNIKLINNDIKEIKEDFKGIFNYRYLTTDFYKSISEKLDKYSSEINNMKKHILKTITNENSFSKILQENNINDTKIKKRLDNIIEHQIDSKAQSESLTLYSKKTNTNSLRLTLKSKNEKDKYNIKLDSIKLNNPILQDYYYYSIYNILKKNYKIKKMFENNINIPDNYENIIYKAKPIPGTVEVAIYDKKNIILNKRIIKFEKNKHKYNNFLHGCRSVLIKDYLYIFGGVDSENKSTKIAYVYYIQTNELKLMPEMLCSHAYQSVAFLDYYKSIIIIGGENNSACELYDMTTGLWKRLPNLNVPRALSNLYLDKFTHSIYTFFGIVGHYSQKNNFTDVIEVLDLKRLALGWNKIIYENKAEMDFKSGYNQILELNKDMILIYGANNMRDFVKKAAVYLLNKMQIVKIDNNIFKEIKENSKNKKILENIFSSYF